MWCSEVVPGWHTLEAKEGVVGNSVGRVSNETIDLGETRVY